MNSDRDRVVDEGLYLAFVQHKTHDDGGSLPPDKDVKAKRLAVSMMKLLHDASKELHDGPNFLHQVELTEDIKT